MAYYHTQYDDVAHLDPRSLQQDGDYALALARRFGNLDLRDLKGADATYFVLPFFGCIVYPVSWSLPLAVFAALLFAAVVALGISKGRLTPGRNARRLSSDSCWRSAIASAAVAVMWSLAKGQPPESGKPSPEIPITPASIAWPALRWRWPSRARFFALFQKRARVLNLWAGALLCWLLLALATSVYMPGATYLFFWPLLFSTVALAIVASGAGPLACGGLSGRPALARTDHDGAHHRAAVPVAHHAHGLRGRLHHRAAAGPADPLPESDRRARAAGGCPVPPRCSAPDASSRAPPYPAPIATPRAPTASTTAWTPTPAKPSGSASIGRTDDWTAHYLGANPQRAALPQFVPFMSWQYLTHDAPAVALPRAAGRTARRRSAQ